MSNILTMEELGLEIIKQAAQQNQKAFALVYEAYNSLVYNVSLRIVNNSADADEVTQDVFIKVFKALPEFKFQCSFKTWVYRITINTAINNYNKRHKEYRRQVDFDTISTTIEASNNQNNDLYQKDNEQMLKKMLTVLSAEQRTCLTLRELQGLSYQEIAQTLKVNINTVRTRIKRAREALIASYKQEVKN